MVCLHLFILWLGIMMMNIMPRERGQVITHHEPDGDTMREVRMVYRYSYVYALYYNDTFLGWATPPPQGATTTPHNVKTMQQTKAFHDKERNLSVYVFEKTFLVPYDIYLEVHYLYTFLLLRIYSTFMAILVQAERNGGYL